MLDLKEFREIKKEMDAFENERENAITISRNIIRISHQIIYNVHRNDFESAEKEAKEIEKLAAEIRNRREEVSMIKVALQEYVEALTFHNFAKKNQLLTRKELDVEVDDYLIGLCDLTGEMVRKAVNDVINKDYSSALKIKDAVSEIYGAFLELDFRNGELRKRFDAIKWNLRKLEDLALSIKLMQK